MPKEVELSNRTSAKISQPGPRTPSEVPLPDEESSVDDEENQNDDDFASVASDRLNDQDANSALLQTLNEQLDEGDDGEGEPLVKGGEEKNKIKATMENVIWRLYNRQLGKDNTASTSHLSAWDGR